MPTYLTPGVYVEEIPSASKPIEGVGTAVAAFVGLAPGGPVNTPMRISNWTQFAKIYGDPVNPDNGPFMEGAYLAHSVYGFFQNGGSLALDRARRRRRRRRGRAARGAARGDRQGRRGLPRRRARGRRRPGHGGARRGGARRRRARTATPPTSSPSRPAARPRCTRACTLKKGRANIATKVNAASSKAVASRRSAPRCPRPRVATGSYALSAPAQKPEKVDGGQFEGDVAKRSGMGGLAAVDEVTMLVMPDIMTLADNGDDTQIARSPGQDDRPLRERGRPDGDPRRAAQPAPAGHPRVAHEHRRLRLEDGGAVLPLDRDDEPAHAAADADPAVGPHGRRVVPRRRQPRRAQGARQRGRSSARTGSPSRSPGRSRAASTRSGSTASAPSPAAASASWGARTLSSDPEWRYINVRRLFNFVSESIMEGTQWSVFEPNDQALWLRLRASVTRLPHAHV